MRRDGDLELQRRRCGDFDFELCANISPHRAGGTPVSGHRNRGSRQLDYDLVTAVVDVLQRFLAFDIDARRSAFALRALGGPLLLQRLAGLLAHGLPGRSISHGGPLDVGGPGWSRFTDRSRGCEQWLERPKSFDGVRDSHDLNQAQRDVGW